MTEKFEFQDNSECPFCNGRLQHTGAYENRTGKAILKCNNPDCYFNQVDFI